MNKIIHCPYFDSKSCSSCHLLPKSTQEIGQYKAHLLKEIFKEELLHDLTLNEIIETLEPLHSRAKAKFSVGGTYDKPIIGITNKNLVTTELEQCPLHYKSINRVIPLIKELIKKFKIQPYQIKSKKGELKGLIIKSNAEQNQLIIRFILKSKKYLHEFKKIGQEIQKKFNLVKIISINIQPIPHQILEGEEEIILTSHTTISETHEDKTLTFGPNSFSQVTPFIAKKLYKKMAEIISINKCQGILDLFCGVGGFSIIASDTIQWGIGVELSKQAIEYAKQSCQENNITNLKFLSDDVEEYLDNYQEKKPNAIICNPPRRGLNEKICQQLNKISPELILYSSCNPTSLQKDITHLSDQYSLEELTPFDMFPLTKHMEVLAVLRRS